MQHRISSALLAVPLATLVLTQCGKKEEAQKESSGVVESIVEGVAESLGLPVGLSPEERVKIVPLAGILRKDVEGVVSFQDLKGGLEKARSLKSWQWMLATAKEETGDDLEEEISMQLAGTGDYLGEEVFMVFGEGCGKTMELYGDAGRRVQYHQLRALTRAFAEACVTGDFAHASLQAAQMNPFQSMAGEVKDFLPQLRELQFPPVLLGVEISDADMRDQAAGQLTQMLNQFGAEMELVSFERAGGSFSGMKLSGAMMASEMEANPGDLTATFGPEVTAELIEIVREKTLVIASGTVGSRVMLYVGSDVDRCPIAETLEDSLATENQLGFIDAFQGKPVHGFLYGDREVLENSMKQNDIGPMVSAISDGLREAEGFGDPRELISLLGMMEERQQALLKFYQTDTLGAVVSDDQGLAIDWFGGYVGETMNFSQAHRLGSLGAGEQTLLFADGVVSPDYQHALREYLDLLVTIGYTAAEHVAGQESASPEVAQFSSNFQAFDDMAREDLLKMWNGAVLADQALGEERVLVVDLAGKVPSVPGIPNGVVEKGRLPRASYLAPVKDRAKLGESWTEIDTALRSAIATAREMGADQLNMLEPTSSQKDDLTTWYFDAAAYSDDLKPSITVTDQWFAASSSRTQALDLIEKASAASDAEGRTGVWMKLDFNVLTDYLSHLTSLAEEHGEEIFPDPAKFEDFQEELPKIHEAIAALSEFDAVTLHERKVDGRRRTSLKISLDAVPQP